MSVHGRKVNVFLLTAMAVFLFGVSSVKGESKDLDQVLSRVAILADLTDAERELFAPAATLRRVQAGEQITRRGENPGKMYLIMDGKTQVWVNGSLVTTITGQTIIGETEFLNRLPMFADVMVEEETDLIELDNAKLTEVMNGNPRIGYVIMRELAVIEAVRLRETTVSTNESGE
ncbi:MAG: cyclic nucleotide-binding domain-containing protein [Deltaproteobacteria bacterium]|nr:cyclic nucleotide-binding domain-containing protein [Deltaproteobacteria bacterium]